MAMKVNKRVVHSIDVEISCGCKVVRSFEDNRYQKPISAMDYTACAKHIEDNNSNIIELMLVERLDEVVEASKPVAADASSTGASTVVPPQVRQPRPPGIAIRKPGTALGQNTEPIKATVGGTVQKAPIMVRRSGSTTPTT